MNVRRARVSVGLPETRQDWPVEKLSCATRSSRRASTPGESCPARLWQGRGRLGRVRRALQSTVQSVLAYTSSSRRRGGTSESGGAGLATGVHIVSPLLKPFA